MTAIAVFEQRCRQRGKTLGCGFNKTKVCLINGLR